jgi:hypothetical protein
MTLDNTYEIQNKPIKEILDNIDTFTTNMIHFIKDHNGYHYNVDLVKSGNLWSAKIRIVNEKQKSNKTS